MPTLSQKRFETTRTQERSVRNIVLTLTLRELSAGAYILDWQLNVGETIVTNVSASTIYNLYLAFDGRTQINVPRWETSVAPGGFITSGSYSPASGFPVSISIVAGFDRTTDKTCTLNATVNLVDYYSPPSLQVVTRSIGGDILRMYASLTHNATPGSEVINAQNRFVSTNDNYIISTSNIYLNRNQSYSGTSYIYLTGGLIPASLLGTELRANFKFWDSSYNMYVRQYTADSFTPPANLRSLPTTTNNVNISVRTITQNRIEITIPYINWIRNETTAMYSVELYLYQNNADTPIFQSRNMRRLQENRVSFNLGTNTLTGTYLGIPQTTTIDAAIFKDERSFIPGSTLMIGLKIRSYYLGFERTTRMAPISVYIPIAPTLTMVSEQEKWTVYNNAFYRVINSANITINNPGNEQLGGKYLTNDSFTSTTLNRIPIDRQEGNIWFANTNPTNFTYTRNRYVNNLLIMYIKASLDYATNFYANTIVYPATATVQTTESANSVRVAINDLSIATSGLVLRRIYLYTPGYTGAYPEANELGNCDVTLQVSKSSTFTTISYEQTKRVTTFFEHINLFDPIRLVQGDNGINYVRVIWKLSTSANLSAFPDLISNTLQINIVGLAPVIDTFRAYLGTDNRIHVLVVETTGAPTPTLQVEVRRNRAEPVYETFTVQNNVDYTLPYSEPGTTWLIVAKATNSFGTVYALDGDGAQAYYNLQIPYTATPNYATVANPRITSSPVQINSQATMAFNWVNMVSNVNRITYDVNVNTTNTPIAPNRFTNVNSGLNQIYNGRRVGEQVSFQLICTLYNSYNEVVERYNVNSNTITLTSIALGNISFTIDTKSTYHSVTYDLVTMNKNNNKLVYMSVSLLNGTTQVFNETIGTDTPDANSPDLDPINTAYIDNLQPNTLYTVLVNVTGINPVDPSRIQRNQIRLDVRTEPFITKPVENERLSISHIVGGMPTTNSDVTITWNSPTETTTDVTNFIVSYRKQVQSFTNVNTQELQYLLTHEMLNLKPQDSIFIRIGARYEDFFGNEIIEWKELSELILSNTNYAYYLAIYPWNEEFRNLIYKALPNTTNERLAIDIYVNE